MEGGNAPCERGMVRLMAAGCHRSLQQGPSLELRPEEHEADWRSERESRWRWEWPPDPIVPSLGKKRSAAWRGRQGRNKDGGRASYK